jgi:threonine dehydrogenase-like Zn-dependent dehydrogenase
VNSSIEALRSDETLTGFVKDICPRGDISDMGYDGHGEFVMISRLEWGGGMSDKTIRTGRCPGGTERMKRLMRLLLADRIDPTRLTSHRFKFGLIEMAFRRMQNKEDDILKPLIMFE